MYILRCSDDSFYIGNSSNIKLRLVYHEMGYFRSCYIFKRRPVKLVYSLNFTDVIQAILFEKRIKGWTRAKKIALINEDFDIIQILSECRNFTHSIYNSDSCP
ncbi:GIY-YIG nuclease family protein [Maribacter sp. MAR_2009_72]|uniref:GIY-YIG nuclease family protein n=1 Tax=Maribacter sp. MAR_2009_72 TaxID=1250050 RepID=UPI0028F7066F|nr:GIY-YIG nuclease family protein [Maribacter sp. MAR_2009_72]